MNETTGQERSRKNASTLAELIFNENKVKWVPVLTKLFQASLALSYIPEDRRKVRVTFIPKANKKDKTSPKSFRPISLSSVLLKTREKNIDEYVKSSYMAKIPLSKHQFAYQEGKSSVTALHAVVTKLERSLEAKEISLAAFLDIEGAFDNSSHNSMISAMTKHNFDKCIIDWVSEMLS